MILVSLVNDVICPVNRLICMQTVLGGRKVFTCSCVMTLHKVEIHRCRRKPLWQGTGKHIQRLQKPKYCQTGRIVPARDVFRPSPKVRQEAQELIAAWNRAITCQDVEPPVPYREGYGIPPLRRRCLLDGMEAYRINEGWVEYRTSLLTWDKVQTEVNIVLFAPSSSLPNLGVDR